MRNGITEPYGSSISGFLRNLHSVLNSGWKKWEKIFVNEVTDRGLISKIYKELIQLIIKKTAELKKKWAEDLNRYFFKEDIQMTKMHMRRY